MAQWGSSSPALCSLAAGAAATATAKHRACRRNGGGTLAVTLGLPSRSPPIQEPKRMGQASMGSSRPVCFFSEPAREGGGGARGVEDTGRDRGWADPGPLRTCTRPASRWD